MRVHLNTPAAISDAHAALRSAKAAGKVSIHVYFDRLIDGRSRSHTAALDVHLAADCDGTRGGCPDGHRWANTGMAGADQSNRAATYDEWGWFLAYLFAQHPDARAGQYKGADHFHATARGDYRITAPVSA